VDGSLELAIRRQGPKEKSGKSGRRRKTKGRERRGSKVRAAERGKRREYERLGLFLFEKVGDLLLLRCE
jgi:hypothetical protein